MLYQYNDIKQSVFDENTQDQMRQDAYNPITLPPVFSYVFNVRNNEKIIIYVSENWDYTSQPPEYEIQPIIADESLKEKLWADYKKDLFPITDALKKDIEPLSHAKEAALSELSFVASQFETNLNKDMYFTSSLGFKVNGDRRTKDNIQDLITTYQSEVSYRDYDNQSHTLDKEELTTMFQEHLKNGFNLYQQKWKKESAINKAESYDELHAIDLTFQMMDFSKTEQGV